jgi:sulfhydrogenase subunit beta (sulfur reductase)
MLLRVDEHWPTATSGFDLALTEILEGARHYFLTEVGTEADADILRELPHRPAEDSEVKAAEHVSSTAVQTMGRKMDIVDIKELLYRNYEHPRWDNVAGPA